MAMRPADAWQYLRVKSMFKDSDCNVLLSDGRKLPVLIRPDTGQLAVEIEDRLFDPQKLPNFQKFELKPEEITIAPTPIPPEPTPQEIFNERMREAREANPGVNELSLRLRVTDQLAKENLAERQQQSRTEQQSSFGTL